MYRSIASGIVASTLGLASVVPLTGQPLCRPMLTVTNAQFSEMIPPTLARTWSAVVSVDASRCQSDAKGYFEIVFIRAKETAPDLEFRERYMWQTPSVNVVVEFAADEAVQRYWIGNVTPCSCSG